MPSKAPVPRVRRAAHDRTFFLVAQPSFYVIILTVGAASRRVRRAAHDRALSRRFLCV